MDIIEIKSLIKNYPLGETTVHALRGVDLTIREGELMSIVGPVGKREDYAPEYYRMH